MVDTSQEILSKVVVWLKYAKYISDLKRRENWQDITERNMSMHIRKYQNIKDEIKTTYKNFVFEKKVLPSMRSLQFGGRPIELSNTRIYNCSFLPLDHSDSFSETMFLLLSGTGVGIGTQKFQIEKLPVVVGPKNKNRRFLIGDSIEGWSDAIKVLMEAYFKNKSDPIFDFRDIRPKGARLITSGGKAPGPDPLRICIDKIRAVLNNAIDRKLSPLEAHDIACHIADAVLAGGIRRAAMISLFSADDIEMLTCKSGAWYELNPQRGRANNSAVLHREYITEQQFKDLWKKIEESNAGEPGIYWTNNYDLGTNPCCVSGECVVDVEFDNTIQRMRVKDVVELINDENKTVKIKSVLDNKDKMMNIVAAAMTRKDAELIRVTDTESGKQIVCTPDHPIFTENRGYVEAQYLNSDDVLKIL